MEEGVETQAGNFPCESHSRPAKTFRGRSFGGSERAGEMCLDARMSGGQSALFFRFSLAHRAADGQYMSQREFLGLHVAIVQHFQLKRWSIVLVYWFYAAIRLKRELTWCPGDISN
jgi:hypothetical protein